MKKWTAILAAAALVFSLAACSSNTGDSTPPATDPVETDIADTDTPDVDGADDAGEQTDAGDAIQGVDDLDGKRVGVQLGTTGDILADDLEGTTVERFNNGIDAVMALKQNKIDAVIIDDQPAKVFAEQNDDIMILPEPFEVEDYAICLAKDSDELTGAFNEAIAALKADGTVQALIDYYIGQEENAAPYESPADADRSNGTLKMGTNAAFPPYEYYEGGQVVGLDADLARAICDHLGYDLEIVDMDFDAIVLAVQSGTVDFGAAGMTVTEDRLQNVNFTDSYCTGTQVIIVNK